MSDDADPQASDALAEQRVVVRYRLVRWRSADNEVGPFRADTIFAALRLIRLERDGVRFAADSLVEQAGFELAVAFAQVSPRMRVASFKAPLSITRPLGNDAGQADMI